MSIWPALRSFTTMITGLDSIDGGSPWDEEMGGVNEPAQDESPMDNGNAVQSVEGGGLEEGGTPQEIASAPIEDSGDAVGVAGASGEQSPGPGNAGNEGVDNTLRMRAWGRGCGGCGISMPATRDGRRALMILGVVLVVLGCIVLGITAEVNRVSGGK
ncbi:hypothetical protein K488DRAFT_72714 [Vararia minispora EC-137]|uniref:Uncharacterized protein n=1 Tax=Vararia minispora EC-137 TaxID=1314806 RepID=A0ACB8QDG6_9AGAM|nr:hypothetical protein K488DRAFT_72714 [Vararia minispora EC-137]